MTIQTDAATPPLTPYPSPSVASTTVPTFTPTERPRRLTRIIPISIGGMVVLTSVLAWIIAKPPNREPISDVKSSDPAPTPSPASSIVPARPQEIPTHVIVALPTGTWILKPRGTSGHGVLKLQNGSDLDSAIKLVTAAVPRRVLWLLYVRAHEKKEISGIGAGSYLLRFTMGQDWDSASRKFLQKPWFYQAGQQLDFTETESTESEHGQYTELTVTLHEIIGGNLPRVAITEALFNEGQ